MNAVPLGIAETLSAAETGRFFLGKRTATGSAAGFVIVDKELKVISFNAEAVRTLTYPQDAKEIEALNRAELSTLLAVRIRSVLAFGETLGQAGFVGEFIFGRRRYVCRSFCANASAESSSEMRVALVLERAPSKLMPLAAVGQQFRLTQRELEVLGYLMQALSSKEIAQQMGVSPSTVKAFLRTMMIKMGVCSRSAAVGKALMSVPLRGTTGKKLASTCEKTLPAGQSNAWVTSLDLGRED